MFHVVFVVFCVSFQAAVLLEFAPQQGRVSIVAAHVMETFVSLPITFYRRRWGGRV